MKYLTLVRHAKSSWKDATLADRDRPLNGRGQRDAPRMGARLAGRGVTPDLLVSSPARRAHDTALAIAAALGYDPSAIALDHRVYEAGSRDLIEIVRGFDDRYAHVMLFGHNPTMTQVVNEFADRDIDNVPTCGVARFALSVEQWRVVAAGRATLIEFDYPKRESS